MTHIVYQNILCALSPTADDLWLLDKALYLAGNIAGHITVLCSCEHPLSGSGENIHRDITETDIRQHQRLTLLPLLQSKGIPACNLRIDFGSTLHCLQKQTTLIQPDIVLLSRSQYHLTDYFFSTTRRALATLNTDLLVCYTPCNKPFHKRHT